jgi:hypothetical protein
MPLTPPGNYLTQIYDVTVAYPGELVQNETDMILKGRLARQVHFDIRRFGEEELPKTSEALNHWIIEFLIQGENMEIKCPPNFAAFG